MGKEIQVDPKKVAKIRRSIYLKESINLKEKTKKDTEMVNELKKIVEQEVDKCY